MSTSIDQSTILGSRAMVVKRLKLCSSLWKNCEGSRAGMDAGQYKVYLSTFVVHEMALYFECNHDDFLTNLTDVCRSDWPTGHEQPHAARVIQGDLMMLTHVEDVSTRIACSKESV